MIQHPTIRDKIRRRSSLTSAAMHEDSNDVNAASSSSTTMIQLSGRDERERIVVWRSISCHHESNRRLQMFSPRVYHHRSPPGEGVTAWRRGRHHQHHRRRLTLTTSIVTLVTMLMMVIVLTPPPQSSSSSSLLLFVSAGNYNNNYNNAANNANQNYQGDDQYSQNTDDGQNDDGNNNNNNNDNSAAAGSTTAATAREWNDDLFDWDVPNQDGFHSLSIMPVSCINYNNGHMIKFDFFDESTSSYQCHFNLIGTFVVSIAHYMRAYFNYQALSQGRDFSLPSDAGYLNCIALTQQQGDADEEDVDANGGQQQQQLYAKIGCMERETFTSTRLQIHLYTDAQCSEPYDDGLDGRAHSNKGYDIDGVMFPTRVSFRPPFFTCQSCEPSEIAATFNKKYGTWYDDDYISQHGQKRNTNNGDAEDDQEGEDNNSNNNSNNGSNGNTDDATGSNYNDDAYIDGTYMSANDDLGQYASNQNSNNYYNNRYKQYNYNKYQSNRNKQYTYTDDYNFNNNNNRGGRVRSLLDALEDESQDEILIQHLVPAAGELERFEDEFWHDVASISERDSGHRQRQLYDTQYDASGWNMCEQVYNYGLYCDEECQSLDAFRADRWSGADIILLSIMCSFMAAMVILIIAKKLRTAKRQKRDFYASNPDFEQFDTPVGINETGRNSIGLPPIAMLVIFWTVILVIVVLASLKFVNETLVFAVVMCVLFFIYMLKLTLFQKRRPVLLAAPTFDENFDSNPLDQHLFR